jgi:hypothetical protein
MSDIHDAIRDGRLPNRLPSQVWGGWGDGQQCSLCDRPITPEQTEVEFELDTDGGSDGPTYRMHTDCYKAWEDALPAATNRLKNGSRESQASIPRRGSR